MASMQSKGRCSFSFQTSKRLQSYRQNTGISSCWGNDELLIETAFQKNKKLFPSVQKTGGSHKLPTIRTRDCSKPTCSTLPQPILLMQNLLFPLFSPRIYNRGLFGETKLGRKEQEKGRWNGGGLRWRKGLVLQSCKLLYYLKTKIYCGINQEWFLLN